MSDVTRVSKELPGVENRGAPGERMFRAGFTEPAQGAGAVRTAQSGEVEARPGEAGPEVQGGEQFEAAAAPADALGRTGAL